MKKDIELDLECDCGREIFRFTYDPNDDLIYIEMFGHLFYERQYGMFAILWKRIKFAWSILIGKEYGLYDVVLVAGQKHLDEIGKWIAVCKKAIK